MLFWKKGTTSSTIALALLVAILASTTSIVNDINSQTETLGGLLNIGDTYLILSENSNSITDSKIDAELANQLNDIANIEYTIPQKIFTATLTASSGNYTALIRGVENVTIFLELRGAYVNGTSAKTDAEANVGEILARLVAIDLGDEVNLTVDNAALKVKVVGVVKTLTQNDAELTVPMEVIHNLTGNDGKISIIEFTLHEDVEEEAILNIIKFLPTGVKVVKAHQLKEFMRDMNGQTLTFLNLWSIAVYAVVAAASYGRHKACSRIHLRAGHVKSPRSQKETSSHAGPNIYCSRNPVRLHPRSGPRNSWNPDRLNHAQVDMDER